MSNLALSKERYVKKHNAAIRSYSQMTLLQRKLSNTLLYNAYHNLIDKDFHEITISQLLSLLSMKTNDYKKIKHGILQLMSTVIEWDITKKTELDNKESESFRNNGWGACTLLSSVQVEGSTIKYEYSKVLRELLYIPSLYSKISLTFQNKFRSLYSLSLYENCMSYLNCNTSGWIKFELFRKLMGVDDSQYKIFRDFSKRVLKPAVSEVNNLSDISIKYEIKKTMRSPSHIKLIVQKKKIESENPVESEKDLLEKLMKYGLSVHEANSVLKKYSTDKIMEKISLMESYKTKIHTPAALLKAALKENFQINSSKLSESKQNESSQQLYKREQEEKLKREEIESNYKKYREEVVHVWLIGLDLNEKILLIDKMKGYFEFSKFPYWKLAKEKLGFLNWMEDEYCLQSVRIYVFWALAENQDSKLKFPIFKNFEEFLKEHYH